MILIIGAGIAGLAAANEMERAGKDYLLLEASDRVGGRIATEAVDGYLLDRGFQVLNPAYSLLRRYLTVKELNLGSFDSGAVLLGEGSQKVFYDPLSHPGKIAASLGAGVLSLGDCWRAAKLLFQNRSGEPGSSEGESTLDYWKRLGFSDRFIREFFTPFFRGVFLDPDLSVSHEFFDYTYSLFATSSVGLPEAGMAALPQAMAQKLDADKIKLNCPVKSIRNGRSVVDSIGTEYEAERILLATDLVQAGEILGTPIEDSEPFHLTTYYYSCTRPPWTENLLGLNSTGLGPVNHLAILNKAQKSYAPEGKNLVSVSQLALPASNMAKGELANDELAKGEDVEIRSALKSLLGRQMDEWEYLKATPVPYALPKKWGSDFRVRLENQFQIQFAGDHCCHPSIQGALRSGKEAAERALSTLS